MSALEPELKSHPRIITLTSTPGSILQKPTEIYTPDRFTRHRKKMATIAKTIVATGASSGLVWEIALFDSWSIHVLILSQGFEAVKQLASPRLTSSSSELEARRQHKPHMILSSMANIFRHILHCVPKTLYIFAWENPLPNQLEIKLVTGDFSARFMWIS